MVVKAADIVEAGLANDTKFRKFTVELDDAELYNIRLADIKPSLESREVFLNVLVEGPASLYVFESAKGNKYFYTTAGQRVPKQLIYRKFRKKEFDDVQENTTYRQQLQQDVSCEGDPWKKFQKLKYQKDDLIGIVQSYNDCKGSTNQGSVAYENRNKSKIETRMSLFAVPKYLMPYVDSEKTDDSDTSIGLGAEVEALTAGRQFGFFVRLEYELLSFETANRIFRYRYDGGYISFTPGLRYHFSRAGRNHVFVDAALSMGLPTEDMIRGTNTEVGAGLGYGASLGLGMQFMDHYRVQARYESPRQITTPMASGASISVSTIGLSVGYTF